MQREIIHAQALLKRREIQSGLCSRDKLVIAGIILALTYLLSQLPGKATADFGSDNLIGIFPDLTTLKTELRYDLANPPAGPIDYAFCDGYNVGCGPTIQGGTEMIWRNPDLTKSILRAQWGAINGEIDRAYFDNPKSVHPFTCDRQGDNVVCVPDLRGVTNTGDSTEYVVTYKDAVTGKEHFPIHYSSTGYTYGRIFPYRRINGDVFVKAYAFERYTPHWYTIVAPLTYNQPPVHPTLTSTATSTPTSRPTQTAIVSSPTATRTRTPESGKPNKWNLPIITR